MAVRFVKFMSYEFANEITRCKYDTVYLFADETVKSHSGVNRGECLVRQTFHPLFFVLTSYQIQ